MKPQDFIKKVEELKGKQADLSKDEDLSIALMNLISLEEHFYFSAMKTNDKKYLGMLSAVRELRKKLLAKIVKNPKGEEWCLPPQTIIFSNPSIKRINTFKEGDRVLTHTGRFMPITNIFKRKYNGKLIKILPYYTNIPLLITPEHPILCATNVRVKQKTLWRKNFVKPNITWKKASDINSSDFLIFPKYKNAPKPLQKLNLSYSWTNNPKFKHPTIHQQVMDIRLTNELMELIGLYIAEGCISKGKYHFKKEKRYMKTSYISWTFSIKEDKLANKVLTYLKNIFKVSAHINKRNEKNIIEITSSKRILIRFFEQFGTKSHNKVLSDWIMHLPEKKVLYLTKGLIEGDGCIQKFSISYATSSETLAYQLRMLLFKHGILHNLSKRALKDSKIGNRVIKAYFPCYIIQINGDSARKFCKIVDLKYYSGEKTSGNFGYVDDKFVMIPIRKIELENYRGNVMNFSVLNDESYTTLNGVVHNCISKHLLAASMRLIEVGTKEQSQGNEKESQFLFESAFNLWSLFFGINLNLVEPQEIDNAAVEETKNFTGKLSQIIKKIVDCCKE